MDFFSFKNLAKTFKEASPVEMLFALLGAAIILVPIVIILLEYNLL